MQASDPPDILITGFGPFPGVPRNPSGVLAARIAANRCWIRLGVNTGALIWPTAYGLVSQSITQLAGNGPKLVFMLGVAARSNCIRIEMVARNRSSLTARDVSGRAVRQRILERGAPALRRGRHGGAALMRELRMAGLRARLSFDAGRYVCNASYWWMLGALPGATRVVFVHIPLPGKAGSRRTQPRPQPAAMEKAVLALVQAEWRRGHGRGQAGLRQHRG